MNKLLINDMIDYVYKECNAKFNIKKLRKKNKGPDVFCFRKWRSYR